MQKKLGITILAMLFFTLSELDSVYAQSFKKNFSDSLFTLCKKNYNEGSYQAAVEPYKAIAFEQLSAEELFYAGLAYTNLRETIKAFQYFQKAVEYAPNHNGYKIQLARTALQLGKTNDAVTNYQSVIETDSNNVTALYELGLIYFDMREYPTATGLFERLVAISDNDFLSSYYLGFSMLLTPNPALVEPALKHLEHSISINMEYVPAISLLASNKFNLKKYYDANAFYSMAIKLRPTNADFYYRSGLCFERLAFYDDALDLYSKAISLDSTEASYFDHLGFAYYNKDDYYSAVTAYKKAASLEENTSYYMNMGFAYAQLDSTKQAIESFQLALNGMQLDKIVNVYNQIAAVYYKKNNFSKAKTAYEKALNLMPENLDAQFFLAVIHDKLQNWQKAGLAYKKVLTLADGDSLQNEKFNYADKRIKELKKR